MVTADRQDAADAGFADAAFSVCFESADRSRMPVRQLPIAARVAPSDAWRANDARVDC